MFQLEYAQNLNGKFHGWVVGGYFPTEAAARAEAKSRGLKRDGDDFMVSLADADPDDWGC
jgi:hypothetical protein